MTVFVHITKIGSNRDAPRIWLEGKRLTACGFVPNDRLQIDYLKDYKRIEITKVNLNGNHKVSGKGSRPIIDINSKQIRDVFPKNKHLKVIGQRHKLFLVRAKK